MKKEELSKNNHLFNGRHGAMWSVGFENYLKEILKSFLGEISYAWKKGQTEFELSLLQKGDKVVIELSENQTIYREELSYNELYHILVPDNKLTYLYLFQDIINELNEGDSKEIVVKGYLNDLLISMSKMFVPRKNQMRAVEEPKFPGYRFVIKDIEYEQLSLF